MIYHFWGRLFGSMLTQYDQKADQNRRQGAHAEF